MSGWMPTMFITRVTLDRLAAYPHSLRVLVEALLYGLQHVLMPSAGASSGSASPPFSFLACQRVATEMALHVLAYNAPIA
jgi:hypothetical protein